MSRATGRGRQDTLAYERAVNERYQHEMKLLLQRQPGVADAIASPRNTRWTRGRAATPALNAAGSPIVGRVALSPTDDMLGDGFYIASWYRKFGSPPTQVVSWAAPVASLFYEGRSSEDSAAHTVCARRTFVVDGEDLVDFIDDVEPDARCLGDPFARRGTERLAVPARPSPVPRPNAVARSGSGARSQPAPEVEVPPAAETAVEPLRAEDAVRIALERPRTGHLASVLATLQPDQYRLVTWSSTNPLVVQGQPGTGKTIVATHRALYLTHPQREPAPLARVALVGPTRQYTDHVRQVIDELGGANVDVRSLPELLCDLAGIASVPSSSREERLDSEWRLGIVLTQAARRMRERGALRGSRAAQIESLLHAVLSGDALVASVVERNGELARWFRSCSVEMVFRDGRFLPLLAAAGCAISPPEPRDQYDHIVVDEAQDVRPLEWRIITGLLRDGATLSLFGDIHQRRSDWSASSWQQLAVDLALCDDAADFEPEVLHIAYRTTEQILRFANTLLPKGNRKVRALRSGPRPEIRRVKSAECLKVAVDAAVDAAARHRSGLVAIITMAPQTASDSMRRLGWSRSHLHHGWTSDGSTIVVLHPANARGLEFDAVVVIEPADFPANVGRHGLLYTSLTRATKELLVVHSKKLPGGLRA